MIDWIDYCLVIFHELPLLYQNQYFLADYGILVLVVLYLREWRKRATALHFSFSFHPFNSLYVCWVMAQSQEATPNLILKVSFCKFVLSWLLPNCTRERAAEFRRIQKQSTSARVEEIQIGLQFCLWDLRSSNFWRESGKEEKNFKERKIPA